MGISVPRHPPSTGWWGKQEAKFHAAKVLVAERRNPEAIAELLSSAPLWVSGFSHKQFTSGVAPAVSPRLYPAWEAAFLLHPCISTTVCLGRSPPPLFLPLRSCYSLNPPSSISLRLLLLGLPGVCHQCISGSSAWACLSKRRHPSELSIPF